MARALSGVMAETIVKSEHVSKMGPTTTTTNAAPASESSVFARLLKSLRGITPRSARNPATNPAMP